MNTELTTTALSFIAAERIKQDEKWGAQNHSYSEWITILGEEFGEFCEAVNETELFNADKPYLGGKENMTKEIIHVAAVATHILEKLLIDYSNNAPVEGMSDE